MPKYRIQITIVNDEGTRFTNVYITECGSMMDALAKAGRWSAFQADEENAAYIKHISIVRMEGNINEEDN